MDAYTGFADIYDACMDNIPYDDWALSICDILSNHGIKDGILCELGCGTGEITERLSAAGYDMIGVDCSEEMLMIARDKQYERKDIDPDSPEILYLMQDMRQMELFGTVRAFISVCDSMNYLLSEEDLLQTFRLVNNYLDQDGLFLFDMKTEACFAALGDETRVEQYRDATLIWENSYKKRIKRNVYRLTIFEKQYADMFQKITETHTQQSYSVDTIGRLLAEAGMEFLGCFDSDTKGEVTKETERIMFIAKEGYQKGKCYTPTEE